MADEVATLALRVASGEAISGLRAVARESDALGAVTDQLKNKILSVVGAYGSWRFGKVLLADAAEGQEALGKFETVLGRFGDKASKVVDELVANFNYDTASARGAISGMVDTFAKAGVSLEQSLDMATVLNKRAADLEAFTNAQGGVAHIAEQMTSGVLGNTMAVRSLGIVLSAEAIKAQMAKEKLEGLSFATERAAKMHATVSIMLQQSASAEGQVARESDNYSNRLRYLNSRIAELRGNLGDALIPTMTRVVEAGARIVDAINSLSPGVRNIIVGVGALTGAFLAFGPTLVNLTAGFKAISAAKSLETLAAKKETSATVEETAAMTAQNSVSAAAIAQSEAIAAAKTAETAARLRNAEVIAAENAGSSLGRGTKTGKLGTAFNNASTLAGAVKPGVFSTANKTEGLLVKLMKPLGALNSRMTGFLTAIGSKLPVIRTFGSVFFRVAGLFGTATTVVGGVVTALEAFKHAPQWIEVAFDKLPGVFSAIGEKAVDGLKKFGTATVKWGKDLVVQGLLGAGQTAKRLMGFKTEATREYELNKRLEENNRRRQAALEAEKALRQAESAMLTAQRTLFQTQSAAHVKYANSLDNDAVKLEKAIQERDRLSAQLAEAQRKFAQAQSVATAANSTADQRAEAVENANALVEEMKTLNEQWEASAEEVTKLADAVHSASKSFENDQKNFEKQREDARKGVEEAKVQNDLDNATSHNERRRLLETQSNKALEDYNAAESAQDEADALNEQVKTLQGQLTNDKASQALVSLQNLAESGDVTSDQASLAYAAAKVNLSEAGYGDLVSQEEVFGQGSAVRLLQKVNEARKAQEKELADKIAERDDKQSLASEAGSRLSAYNQAQRAVTDEDKAYDEQKLNEERENKEHERQLNRENATFQRSIDETLFNRQLQASDAYYSNDAFGAASSRYEMIGARGEQEWNVSMASLKEQQAQIDEINKQLEPLDKRFREGTLTEEDAKQREYLLSQKNTLESEYRSDYQSAIQKRLQTEDTLLGLENTMRSEYLKQAQAYVDEEGNALRERLTAEAQAQEEEQKRRLEERSKVEEEARQAVEGQKAVTAGSSDAFRIASRIYERGQENLPPEKKIEESTQKIEEYVKTMQEQMMAYFAEQSGGMTLSLGY